MKVLQLILLLLGIVGFVEISQADDGMDLVAMKRPFCNAFTGCGRKRDPAYSGSQVQLPIPIYRTLLRLAARNSNSDIRMRQRLVNGPDSLDYQEQLPPPSATIY